MNKFSEIRKAKGLSQQAVANYLGISRQAYSNYESERREANYETLLMLCELFDCSMDDLFGRKSAISEKKQVLIDEVKKMSEAQIDAVLLILGKK